MGIIIGGILGFKFGSYFGMLFGAWLGHTIERQLVGPKITSSTKKQTQESFFNALFLTMGRLAKVDGQVSSSEIKRAESIMQHMNLNSELRQRAIDLFNQGKDSNYDIERSLRQFGNLARRSLSLKQIFLEMLVDVAEADGMISRAEQQLIERACELIRYPVQLLYAMMKMRGFAGQSDNYQGRQGGHAGREHQQRRTNPAAPFNPYQVLGVDQSDNKATIRKAYKRLMSQHHPDKLVAKGLPPEMMKVAEEKAKQVQLAWEKVKDLKGW
ncbi:co-chaperone DjlA [Marinicella sp. S1101]|uniref:co-chaperone DjlA n=1 Tax=Marinicella marina TaxID=2996016 RepID=UPI002260DCB8|nr:co-chaperone DjlA [Marinicella marina]MCX7554563.1 co-chaperone DjlA [Marinicella marina]MDJ1141053.1 co-chaperone DjlA [Marinicella marina]